MFLSILQVIAAVATALLGVFVIIKPTAIYSFTGLTAGGVRGITEIRAIFGGLFIGLGAAPLILGNPAAFTMLGITYLAIALTRIGNMAFEPCTEQSNIISLASEIVLGVILVLPL